MKIFLITKKTSVETTKVRKRSFKTLAVKEAKVHLKLQAMKCYRWVSLFVTLDRCVPVETVLAETGFVATGLTGFPVLTSSRKNSVALIYQL